MRVLKSGDKCEVFGCSELASWLVFSREKEVVMKACHHHEDVISDEGDPEYYHVCPNCGCSTGIN